MRNPAHPLLLALFVLFAPTARAEAAWRYVGADGEIAYAAEPPAGVSAEAVTLPESGPTTSEGSDPAGETPVGETPVGETPVDETPVGDTPVRDRLTPAQQAALDGLLAAEADRAREAARLQAANCDRARGVLERLSKSGRIRVRDAEGQERAMSEEERQSRIQDAAEVVAETCPRTPER
jgi:hypothetical protein